jgi:hypothetical protein
VFSLPTSLTLDNRQDQAATRLVINIDATVVTDEIGLHFNRWPASKNPIEHNGPCVMNRNQNDLKYPYHNLWLSN